MDSRRRQHRREDDVEDSGIVKENPVTTWERHGQSIIAAIVLLVLAWVGTNVSDGVKNDAVMATQMASLQTQVEKLETTLTNDMEDRYRGRDAERDFAAVYQEINRVRDDTKSVRRDNDNFMREQASRGPRISSLENQYKELAAELRDLQLGRK